MNTINRCRKKIKPSLESYDLFINKKSNRNFPSLTSSYNFTSSSYGKSNLLTYSRDFANIDSKDKLLKSIKDYRNDVTSLMSNYIYQSPNDNTISKIEALLTKTKQTFYNNKKNEVSKILNHSRYHTKYKSWENIESEDSKIQVYLKNTDFKDPLDSLELITRNKVIHDKLLENYQEREVKTFEKSMTQVNMLENQKKISEKAKITTVIPKIAEQSIFQINSQDQSDNNSNNNVNSTTELTQTKKKIITIPNINFINKKLFLLAKTLYSSKCFPESREQFSFSNDPVTNSIYLYGGFSSNIKSNSLWQLDASTFSWSNLTSNNVQPELRTGHTGIVHKRKLYIFGGKYVNIPIMGDLDIFDFETKTWSSPPILTSSFLKLRRHHISCLIGQQMLIHGGISETGEYLNDMILLNLNPYKWVPCPISSYSENPTLAMHSCALVVQNDIKNSIKFNIFKFPEQSVTKRIYSRIKERGLYIFGGKSKDDQGPTNKLRVLRIGKKPLDWITLETNGKGPSPRYLSSLNFFEEGNFLIVHGGRNDYDNSSCAFNDTYVFELYRLEWLRVVFDESIKVMRRYSHGSIVSGRNLIIFGGMNGNHFLGSGLFIINLDPEMAAQINQRELGFPGLKVELAKDFPSKIKVIDDESKTQRSVKKSSKKPNILKINTEKPLGSKKVKLFTSIFPKIDNNKS